MTATPCKSYVPRLLQVKRWVGYCRCLLWGQNWKLPLLVRREP